MGKFAQLTADLIPGVTGRKVQAGAEGEYQHHDSIPEEVLMITDLKSFRQDNLSFRKDSQHYPFFPTAGPASRTKLGIHVGIHTVVKRRC